MDTKRKVRDCQRDTVYFGILPGAGIVLYPSGNWVGKIAQTREPLHTSSMILLEGGGPGPGCRETRSLSGLHVLGINILKKHFMLLW